MTCEIKIFYKNNIIVAAAAIIWECAYDIDF